MQQTYSRRRPHDIVHTNANHSNIDVLPQPYRFINSLLQNEILLPLFNHVEHHTFQQEDLHEEGKLRNSNLPQCNSHCLVSSELHLVPILRNYVSAELKKISGTPTQMRADSSLSDITTSTNEPNDTTIKKTSSRSAIRPLSSSALKKKSAVKAESEEKETPVSNIQELDHSEISDTLDSILDCIEVRQNYVFIVTRFGRIVILNSRNGLVQIYPDEIIIVCSKRVFDISIKKEDIAVPEDLQTQQPSLSKKKSLKNVNTSLRMKSVANVVKATGSPKKTSLRQVIESANADTSPEIEAYIENEIKSRTEKLYTSSDNYFSIGISEYTVVSSTSLYVIATSYNSKLLVHLHVMDAVADYLFLNCFVMDLQSYHRGKQILNLQLTSNASHMCITFNDGSCAVYKLKVEAKNESWTILLDQQQSSIIYYEGANAPVPGHDKKAKILFLKPFSLMKEVSDMNQMYKIYNAQNLKQTSQLPTREMVIWWNNSRKLLNYNLEVQQKESQNKQTVLIQLERITCVCIDDSTEKMCTGSDKGSVIVWDTRIGSMMNSLSKHSAEITHICFYKDLYVITASADAIIKIHDLNTSYNLHTINCYHDEQTGIEGLIAWDHLPLFTCVTKNFVDVFDIAFGTSVCTLEEKSLKQLKELKQKQQGLQIEAKSRFKSSILKSGDYLFVLRRNGSEATMSELKVYNRLDILLSVYPSLKLFMKDGSKTSHLQEIEKFMIRTRPDLRNDKSVVEQYLSLPSSLLSAIADTTNAPARTHQSNHTNNNAGNGIITLSYLKQKQKQVLDNVTSNAARISRAKQVIESERIERRQRIAEKDLMASVGKVSKVKTYKKK